jgi:Ni2+-binding GTPase involved in maturation of urease and hydrogenase
MKDDAAKLRQSKPHLFTDLSRNEGTDEIRDFICKMSGLPLIN